MQKRNFLLPLTGAVGAGILIGACARQLPPSSTRSDLEQPAQAQVPAPRTTTSNNGNSIRNATDLARLSATYANLAKSVTPAVVNISTRQVVPGRVMEDPYGGMFGGGGTVREPDRQAQGLGSGVIVDARGIIVTNNHVVKNASTITVTLNDRRRFSAKLVGTDPDTDLAVLRISAPKDLPTVPWADSDKAQVGDIVLAVGSPFGLNATVTQGIISAKDRRDLDLSRIEDFLQTDAAINPGNSGGALIDINGRLVGINTAILSRSGGNQGIGLAIPAKLARNVSGQILASGQVVRGWAGIAADDLTPDLAQKINYSGTGGVLVTGVASRGPAAQLPWVQRGANVIVGVDGTPIETVGQMRNIFTNAAPGTTLNLEVWQDGKTRTFPIRLIRQPAMSVTPNNSDNQG